MDRYLCRVKAIDGEWVIGHYVHDCFWGDDCLFVKPYRYPVEIDPSTLCQCTGLKDKNGVLIFENDIVKYNHKDFAQSNTTYIVFDNYSWRLKNTILPFGIFVKADIEVIGNTIDNPELVEVAE